MVCWQAVSILALPSVGIAVLSVIAGHSSDHRVSESLLRPMRTSLHVLVVLLCSVYGAFSRSLLF